MRLQSTDELIVPLLCEHCRPGWAWSSCHSRSDEPSSGKKAGLAPFSLTALALLLIYCMQRHVLFSVPVCAQIICTLMCFPRHLSIPGVLGTVAGRCTLDRRRPLVTAGDLPSMLFPFFQSLLADTCLGSLLHASVFHNVA